MSNKPKRVMMIDDNEIDLKINSKLINITHLFEDIIICNSAEAGLEYLRKHLQDQQQLPEFILLDIQMPDMDGFDFLEEFKRFPKSFTDTCPVAMLSSTLDFGDIQKAEANPYVIKLLKKPLLPTELAKLI
ncbi:response regulator [Pedobacter sp. KR3-3]|uniref:Response regulator n=1 Tax=Pedobacter albus TaxID=3113905 RepID=A0ABU7I3G9_9SPHI|nr:response regulator [Pedobacter sp. KR3-3]MEE1943856.1 response regulator [Pedobacter sp. KR3-3]